MSSFANPAYGNRPANVIWIFGDQHRAQTLGYRGDPNVRTPNIDNLARNGIRFDQAISGAPWCTPFRASLLTGLYPHQHGADRTPSALDPAIPTIVSPLKEAGYHTAWIGKWHVDGSNSREHYIPPERRGGFDYWVGFENNNNQYESYVYGGDNETPRRLKGYETDALTDLLISHVVNHVEETGGTKSYQPFFASLSVQPPHSPYVAPEGFGRNPASVELRQNVPQVPWIRDKATMDMAGYSGMVENIDWNIGRIKRALAEISVDRETYIVFFSDHGDMLGSHGQWEKSSPWEESIRIPFIVSTVGGSYNQRTGITDALINHVDIAPTTLGLCGISVPKTMVGYDYSGLCVSPDRPEYRGDKDRAVPDSAYMQQIPRKMHQHSVNRAWRGIVTRDGWKYVCTPGNDWLLHNLHDDPFEQANYCYDVAYQKDKERCHNLLKRWIADTGDTFNLPNISIPGS